MRLSASLSRNILEATVGGLLYKFKIKKRRHTFFFEDILAEYIKKCQESGFDSSLQKIGQEWMSRVMHLIPNALKKVPKIMFINLIMKSIWTNLGLMDDLKATQKNNIFKIKTKNEGLTRIIGKNELATGLYLGALNSLFKSHIKLQYQNQSKQSCEYVFEITKEPFEIKSKGIETYNKLNEIPKIKGKTLKDLLKVGLLKLSEDNRIYFRGKPIGPIENTVFHLIGHHNILINEVPTISFNYFDELIDKNTSIEKKLILIKTLLQAMGWGIVIFTIKSETKILMEIRNPPYGLQPEKDNWNFLINVILGYLWIINKKFKIDSIEEEYKRLVVDYRITG